MRADSRARLKDARTQKDRKAKKKGIKNKTCCVDEDCQKVSRGWESEARGEERGGRRYNDGRGREESGCGYYGVCRYGMDGWLGMVAMMPALRR